MSAKKIKSKSSTREEKIAANNSTDHLNSIVSRAVAFMTRMIHIANNRDDEEKGDPKVGGHPAGCSSSAHILGALHLISKSPFDHLAVKPHASPMDHSYNHLLRMFAKQDRSEFTEDEAKNVMHNLRHFMDPSDPNHIPAFQSYHAAWDPDAFNFFPSGTVGIPPVVSTFTALAYRFAKDHGFEVPENVHFWSLIGDSEFREGSLAECMPDTAERELGNVTWIIDYNRQNLDGTRIKNETGVEGTDAERIERLATANGWTVIHARHGRKREILFKKIGEELRAIFESFSDFEQQALLVKSDGNTIRSRILEAEPKLKSKLSQVTDEELKIAFEDFGGHDIVVLSEIFNLCRKSKRPTMVIAHTIKGWGIPGLKARTGNHSMLPDEADINALSQAQGIPLNDPFKLFDESTPEGKFLKSRGEYLREGRAWQWNLKDRNLKALSEKVGEQNGEFPKSFNINLKLSPWANTQWMWGQLAAKLIRIATNDDPVEPEHNHKKAGPLTDDEKMWSIAAKKVVTLAPDVGTSTNLNPSMDGKIYGPDIPEDFEEKYQVKDVRRPDLVPFEKQAHRHLRFEIEEANAMSCLGAFGKMGDHIGVKLLPLMTVYDFFIKRALDQYFYNLYWKSSFILVGTPSGVTLSPEGAQHSWKSDFQIPNGINWEPAFALEMDWILADAVRRHITGDNHDREGVLIRAVTRGIEQKPMIENLRKQACFQGVSDEEILEHTRLDVLSGGYWLINFEGYEGYAPGDNVVHLFVMGALAPEAVKASEKLLEIGIFANVCVVTSPDLVAGSLARENGYIHLKKKLGVNGNLYLNPSQSIPVGEMSMGGSSSGARIELKTRADLLSLRGSRIPIIAIVDGEPGLLDNIGSIAGVPQDTLAVRKHSKSGKPSDVYRYHHLDPDSIKEAALRILEETASEEIVVSTHTAAEQVVLQSQEDNETKEVFTDGEQNTSIKH